MSLKRGQDDLNRHNHPAVSQPPIGEEVRNQAFRNLCRMYKEGKLPPIAGWQPWEGSVLDAWMNLLGLDQIEPPDTSAWVMNRFNQGAY